MKTKYSYVVIPFAFSAGLIIGYMLNEPNENTGFSFKKNHVSNSDTNSYIATKDIQLNSRISSLEQVVYSMNDSLKKLDTQILRLTNRFNRKAENSDHKSQHDLSGSYNQARIDVVKSQLFARLSDPTITFPRFISSDEMRSLPANERERVMKEVTRRLESGEINKETFLPGYSNKN